jgi:hypothetical protein
MHIECLMHSLEWARLLEQVLVPVTELVKDQQPFSPTRENMAKANE